MFYSEDEEKLVKKFTSYKEACIRGYKTTLTKFLNLREQKLLEFVIGKSSDVYLYFSNVSGIDEAKRALISPFEIEPEFKIEILKLEYNKKFIQLDHRHLLGNILGLQIERNMIGDILINKDNDIYLVVSLEMADFIKTNLTAIDHTPINFVNVSKVEGDFSPNLKITKHFVSSLRVDLIASEGFNISRSESQELIINSCLKINQRVELNPVKNIKEFDIISLKGKGRIKIVSIGGTSKSGKILIEIGKFL
jgi:RNA-binding protein YlmH